MSVAEWILVVMLSVALLVFLIAGIVLIFKLIRLSEEAQKVITTTQHIATKADDIVDNVKGMTSVGGIVKTFANRVVENQERRYAEENAAREATTHQAERAAEKAENAASAESTAKANSTSQKRASKTVNDVTKKSSSVKK